MTDYLVDKKLSLSGFGGNSPGKPWGDINVKLLNLKCGLQ